MELVSKYGPEKIFRVEAVNVGRVEPCDVPIPAFAGGNGCGYEVWRWPTARPGERVTIGEGCYLTVVTNNVFGCRDPRVPATAEYEYTLSGATLALDRVVSERGKYGEVYRWADSGGRLPLDGGVVYRLPKRILGGPERPEWFVQGSQEWLLEEGALRRPRPGDIRPDGNKQPVPIGADCYGGWVNRPRWRVHVIGID